MSQCFASILPESIRTMRTFVVFCIVTVQCILALSSDEEWSMFKIKYGKVYKEAEEDTLRRNIWNKRIQRIRIHNEAADRGRYSYRMGMNQFGDTTEEEMAAFTTSIAVSFSRKKSAKLFASTKMVKDLPAEVDWRKKGIVTPSMYQGDCASGYAFSATGSLEGLLALKAGNLTALSVQNLVDCSQEQGNFGCMGGTMDNCFQYVADNNGIDSKTSYPYEGRGGQCHFNRSGVAGMDIGYGDIQTGNETALQQAVAEIGPIATAIDASQESFRFYTSGVYDDPKCLTHPDHGILLVGYGHDKSSEKDYWLLRNSYGETWGMDGYLFLARNEGNRCGVATVASYPLL